MYVFCPLFLKVLCTSELFLCMELFKCCPASSPWQCMITCDEYCVVPGNEGGWRATSWKRCQRRLESVQHCRSCTLTRTNCAACLSPLLSCQVCASCETLPPASCAITNSWRDQPTCTCVQNCAEYFHELELVY